MAFKIGQRAAPQGSHFLSEQFSGLSENVQEWQEVEFEDCEFFWIAILARVPSVNVSLSSAALCAVT